MGVTINSINHSYDMGYGGFIRFRTKVAENCGPEFGEHYKNLNKAPMWDEERTEFFEKYDEKTEKMLADNLVSTEIANFCYQPDSEGEIDQEQAKQVYNLIKDCDGDIIYGYIAKPDCTKMSDLQKLFKDCAENGDVISWI